MTGWGLALFACGTTLPYAATFDKAGHVGTANGFGPGIAQGVVSVIAAPASAFGPPLFGSLLGQQGSFALPFGALVPVGAVALISALLVGSLLTRTRDVADLQRLRERDNDAYLAQVLAIHSRVTQRASTRPSIVSLGVSAQGRGAAIIRRLQHTGGLPLLLPLLPSSTAGEASDRLADEAFFRETFDQYIWPLFCQLLNGQTRGLCLIEGSQRVKDTNGRRASDPLDLLPRATSDAWSTMLQRYLALLGWLVGMPVLGASWELHSLELSSRMKQGAPATERLWLLPAKQEPLVCAQFVAACAAYTPPSPEDLAPFCDEIYGWLRRRDRAFIRQLYQLQMACGQETTGMFEVIAPVAARQPRKQEAATKTVPTQRGAAR